jgi:hypothetical protein
MIIAWILSVLAAIFGGLGFVLALVFGQTP